MSDRARWINYKGIKILFNDYNGLQGNQLLEQIDLCTQFVKETNKNDILLLVDVMNVEVSKMSQLKFAEAAKQVKGNCKRIAVIGLSPIKRSILNIINKITGLRAEGIKTIGEAKEWLISN